MKYTVKVGKLTYQKGLHFLDAMQLASRLRDCVTNVTVERMV